MLLKVREIVNDKHATIIPIDQNRCINYSILWPWNANKKIYKNIARKGYLWDRERDRQTETGKATCVESRLALTVAWLAVSSATEVRSPATSLEEASSSASKDVFCLVRVSLANFRSDISLWKYQWKKNHISTYISRYNLT